MLNVGFKLGISQRKKGFEKYREPISEKYFTLDVSKLGFAKLK